jgi:putative RNA 2'-phosphotransferase
MWPAATSRHVLKGSFQMSSDSKFLSRVLRHEHELLDIRIGREGWVLVDELLRKLK